MDSLTNWFENLPYPTALWIALKSTIVLAISWLGTLLFRRSPAIRHAIWSVGLFVVLCLPIFVFTLPQVSLAWLPAKPVIADIKKKNRTTSKVDIKPKQPRTRSTPRTDIRKPKATDNGNSLNPPSRKDPSTDQRERGDLPESAAQQNITANVLLFVWFIGGMFTLLPMIVGIVILRIRNSKKEPTNDKRLNRILKRSCDDLSITRPVQLILCDKTDSPATWGIVRPTIILPHSTINWPSALVRISLLHELSHISRCDWLMQLLARFSVAINWFNPLAWFAAKQLSLEAEYACDAQVLSHDAVPAFYAESILQMAHSGNENHQSSLAVIPMFHTSNLIRRVKMILSEKSKHVCLDRKVVAILFLTTLLITSAASVINLVNAEEPTKTKKSIKTKKDVKKEEAPKYTKEQIAKAKKNPNYNKFQKAADISVGTFSIKELMIFESFPPVYDYTLKVTPTEVIRGSEVIGKSYLIRYSVRQVKEPKLPVGKKCILASRKNGFVTVLQLATKELIEVAKIASQQRRIKEESLLKLAKTNPKKHPLYKKLKDATGVAILNSYTDPNGVVVLTNSTQLVSQKMKVEHNFKGKLASGKSQTVHHPKGLRLPEEDIIVAIYYQDGKKSIIQDTFVANEEMLHLVKAVFAMKYKKVQKVVDDARTKNIAAKAKANDPEGDGDGPDSGSSRSSEEESTEEFFPDKEFSPEGEDSDSDPGPEPNPFGEPDSGDAEPEPDPFGESDSGDSDPEPDSFR